MVQSQCISAVFCLDGWVARFQEQHLGGVCLFAIMEDGSEFTFGSTGGDFMQDLAQDILMAPFAGCREHWDLESKWGQQGNS